MKTKISLVCFITGFLVSTNLSAAPAAGGGSGGSAGAAAPAAPANRIVPSSPAGSINQQGQMDTGIPNPTPPASDTSITTPPTSIPPTTGQSGTAAGQIANGNNPTTANNNNSATLNRTVTPSDRLLLTTLNQTVGAQLGVTSQGAMPVHFLIANGAVTLVGTVPTADESQRILARVQQTPGVLSVFNDLRVGTTTQTAANQQSSFVGAVTDHAFSPADKSLLTAVQQAAGTQLGINGASAAQMPVHFSIENGVVGVSGQVGSLQEKQAILAAIQGTTGVTRVVDNMSLASGAANSVNSTSGNLTPSLNNNLPPTSRNQNQTNRIFLNTTNSSGF
jgi:osmotically-inducible protein OsmY